MIGILLGFGSFSQLWAAPANDNFDNAVQISDGVTTGNLTGATQGIYEPSTMGNLYGVWFKWRTTTVKDIVVVVSSSQFDPQLLVYSKSDTNDYFSQIAADDDSGGGTSAQVTLSVVPGATYWFCVAVSGNNPSPGAGGFNLAITSAINPCDLSARPANSQSYLGSGVVNSDGAGQVATMKIPDLASGVFYVRIQNNDSVQRTFYLSTKMTALQSDNFVPNVTFEISQPNGSFVSFALYGPNNNTGCVVEANSSRLLRVSMHWRHRQNAPASWTQTIYALKANTPNQAGQAGATLDAVQLTMNIATSAMEVTGGLPYIVYHRSSFYASPTPPPEDSYGAPVDVDPVDTSPTATPDPNAEGDSEDVVEPGETPSPEPQGDELDPVALGLGLGIDESEEQNPTVAWSVYALGFQKWRARVNVYAVSSSYSGAPTPVKTFVSALGQPTALSWNTIFGTTPPPSGLYFYDVKLEPSFDPTIPYMEANDFGMANVGVTPGAIPLSGSYSWNGIQNVEVQNVIDDEANTQRVFHVRCQLDPTNFTGDSKNIQPVAIALGLRDEEMARGTLKFVPDTDGTPGNEWFEGDVKVPVDVFNAVDPGFLVQFRRGGSISAPVQLRGRMQPRIVGAALAYRMPNAPSSDRTGRNQIEGTVLELYTFLLVQRYDGAAPIWYGSFPMNTAQFANMKFGFFSVDAVSPNGTPYFFGQPDYCQGWSSLQGQIPLQPLVEWFTLPNVVRTWSSGTYRYYGFNNPRPLTSIVRQPDALRLTTSVQAGTTWYGARISWLRARNVPTGVDVRRAVAQLPSDRRIAGGRKTVTFEIDSYGNEYQNGVRLTGNARFQLATVGKTSASTTLQSIWGSNSAWNGRLSGRKRIGAPTFGAGDPFFAKTGIAPATQAAFNAKVLSYGWAYVGVPYSWGGQTFGGRQSKSPVSGQYTRSKNTPKGVRDPEERGDPFAPIGKSNNYPGIAGFGLDCSGFVTEVYNTLGAMSGQLGASGFDSTSNALNISWRYARAGDYASSSGHIVFLTSTPALEADGTSLRSINTLEAFPRSDATDLSRGRVRVRTRGANNLEGLQPRRWIAR